MAKKALAIWFLTLLILTSIGTQFVFAAPRVPESGAGLFGGTIVDREGVGISDASVLVERDHQTWSARSDRNGQFRLKLPVGAYRITIDHDGFKKVIVPSLAFAGESSSAYRFPMEVGCCVCTVLIRPEDASAAGTVRAYVAVPEPEPNIGVNGYYASDKAQRGRIVRGAIVMEIPAGYHVNANRPLGKYAIATTLKIEAPSGVTVGPIAFPRAIVRKIKAGGNEPLAVYEGRAIMRFNVTVPANYGGGELTLKARLRYQSCNDEVCFPPKNQDVDMGIGVVGASDRVQRTNGWVFGGK
jgi:Carboxypeptidase regulatory-like domain/Thiol:disulfide interchange protein DsbD, N-terminal